MKNTQKNANKIGFKKIGNNIMLEGKTNYCIPDNLNTFWDKTYILCNKLIKEYQKLDDQEAIEMLEWIKNSDLEYDREIRRFNDLFGFTEALDTSRMQRRRITRLTKKLHTHIFSVFK
ncbi:MAG: hypothetical protein JSV62_13950 [Promethearchaeota archaeon]|nr:MAG: hypothetical protein JSV62_13950 [Candidatus Lokiarchaeota archaeon]